MKYSLQDKRHLNTINYINNAVVKKYLYIFPISTSKLFYKGLEDWKTTSKSLSQTDVIKNFLFVIENIVSSLNLEYNGWSKTIVVDLKRLGISLVAPVPNIDENYDGGFT